MRLNGSRTRATSLPEADHVTGQEWRPGGPIIEDECPSEKVIMNGGGPPLVEIARQMRAQTRRDDGATAANL